MTRHIRELEDQRGAIAAEYGVLMAMLVALLIAAMVIFGGLAGDLFDSSCQEMDAAVTALTEPDCTN